MRLQEVSISSLPAVLIGAVHTCFFVLCWAYIATYSPLVPWLVARGVTGSSLQMILFIADFLVSVLLCLPAAFLLHRLLPPKRARCILPWRFCLASCGCIVACPVPRCRLAGLLTCQGRCSQLCPCQLLRSFSTESPGQPRLAVRSR